MRTVKVEIPQAKSLFYPIFIGNNILNQAGDYIKDHTKAHKLLMVSNDTVYSLYGEKIKESLINAGFETEILLLEDGEQYKNINSLEKILTKAIEQRLERKDAIIALGGGVVGDVTGFAAATYLRGVDFIQIPTTLLAQVDSSVGGKTAINHRFGKNLIGNFYQPKVVLTDITTLNTLSASELKVGLAEVLKYGFIEKTCGLSEKIDTSFIDFLDKNKESIMSLKSSIIEKLIKYCCELKASVVNQDEKEAGLRAILNFGHTIGHAVEKCYNYRNMNHGKAVAIGMRGAFFIAEEKNLIAGEYCEKCLNLLDKYEMNYKIDDKINPESLYKAMQVDKKVQNGKIRFVLPANISEVAVFKDVTENQIVKAIKKLYYTRMSK